MSRAFFRHAATVTGTRSLLRQILNPFEALRARLLLGDEAQGQRQRAVKLPLWHQPLSQPLHAQNQPQSVQKPAPSLVKRAGDGDSERQAVKKKLMKNSNKGTKRGVQDSNRQQVVKQSRTRWQIRMIEFSEIHKHGVDAVEIGTLDGPLTEVIKCLPEMQKFSIELNEYFSPALQYLSCKPVDYKRGMFFLYPLTEEGK